MADSACFSSGASNVVQDLANSGSSNSENVVDYQEKHTAESVLGFVLVDCTETLPFFSKFLYQLARKAKDAGAKALQASNECRNVISYAKESITIAEERASLVKEKAGTLTSRSEAIRYRRIADKLRTAAKMTDRTANDLDIALQFAGCVAELALSKAENMFIVLKRMDAKLIYLKKTEFLDYAMKKASSQIPELKFYEYLVLKAIKRCWEDHMLPENDDSIVPYIPDDDGPREWMPYILSIIFSTTGYVVFVLNGTLSNEDSIRTMVIIGIVSIIWPTCKTISTFLSSISSLTRNYIQKRSVVLNFIEGRLGEDTQYMTIRR